MVNKFLMLPAAIAEPNRERQTVVMRSVDVAIQVLGKVFERREFQPLVFELP